MFQSGRVGSFKVLSESSLSLTVKDSLLLQAGNLVALVLLHGVLPLDPAVAGGSQLARASLLGYPDHRVLLLAHLISTIVGPVHRTGRALGTTA